MLRFLLLIICFPFFAQAQTRWIEIRPGLEYVRLQPETAGRYIHAFAFDPAHYHLGIKFAHHRETTNQPISTLVGSSNIPIAINGGFFDEKNQPLGLRIVNHQLIFPLRPISWWGIFILDQGHARIIAPQAWKYHAPEFALQCGPRLVVNGHIPQLKTSTAAQRSVIGIDVRGRVIMAVTEQCPLSMQAFAEVLQKPLTEDGLACKDALNLDGGSSSQLYAHIDSFNLHVVNFSPIAEAVTVTEKVN